MPAVFSCVLVASLLREALACEAPACSSPCNSGLRVFLSYSYPCTLVLLWDDEDEFLLVVPVLAFCTALGLHPCLLSCSRQNGNNAAAPFCSAMLRYAMLLCHAMLDCSMICVQLCLSGYLF
jgi:hypothetical protein